MQLLTPLTLYRPVGVADGTAVGVAVGVAITYLQFDKILNILQIQSQHKELLPVGPTVGLFEGPAY